MDKNIKIPEIIKIQEIIKINKIKIQIKNNE